MSIKQYQQNVNSSDKKIAELEKKKAAADKKANEAQKKASKVSISKNASAATIKRKLKEQQNYQSMALKASEESAALTEKIAKERNKRNSASMHLQKEEQKQMKKQEKLNKQMQQSYEKRISELQQIPLQKISTISPSAKSDGPYYDVFVSHAWEDKESFVDEFVDALKSLGIKVWYDTSQIKWGDSMRERIDDGLKKSRFGVAVLSPDYIAENKYWTKAELDGLFQLESVNGKTLLPIWHNLTKQQVMNYSPIIANKKAMTTAVMTAQEIAEELLNIIPKNNDM